MNALILHPSHASPSKPGDQGEFQREALKFAMALERAEVRKFNNRAGKPARRREVEALIASGGPWDLIAVFGHGLKTSIQTGHSVDEVPKLADVIQAHCAPFLRVELYCCDAARDDDADKRDDVTESVGGDGGFADALRDALTVRGITGHVDAHSKPGHTTKNPHVRRFVMGDTLGARFLVPPYAPDDATKAEKAAVRKLWWAWDDALKTGDLRFRFPMMTEAAIHAELGA